MDDELPESALLGSVARDQVKHAEFTTGTNICIDKMLFVLWRLHECMRKANTKGSYKDMH